MNIDVTEYKLLYIKTARDLIGAMKQNLQILETDRCNQELIADFHRAAHSFKSQSLVMGYTKSGLVGKLLEQIFRDIKEKKSCVPENMLPILNQCIQKLSDSISTIETQGNELDLTTEIESLTKLTPTPVT